jgi:CheY-like chemotaxis protein
MNSPIKKHILIAEDYPLNQEIIKSMLEDMGYTSDIAIDGDEALEKYKTNHYDLIIIDIHMPKKDGYELAREIRQIEKEKKHTLLLALTADALPENKEKSLAAGIDAFMTKPIDVDTFEIKINELLHQNVIKS